MEAASIAISGRSRLARVRGALTGAEWRRLAVLAAVIIGAGFAEETVYRGYSFERLGKLLGRGAAAKAAMVLLTSALFAAAHYPDQGLAGAEQAAITGLTFGGIFAASGRIWLPMVAHAASLSFMAASTDGNGGVSLSPDIPVARPVPS